MQTLFGNTPHFPSGFTYHPDFITAEEEENLISIIQAADLHPMIFQGFEAKRKTASFGFDYSFDQRKLSEGRAIPLIFNNIIKKVADKLRIASGDLSEILLTEYPVGSVINWHRDAPPFELIAGISLHSPCIFKLRPHDKTLQTRKAILSVPIAPRSLYVLQHEARTNWQHSISPVKDIRYSLTLRTLKK